VSVNHQLKLARMSALAYAEMIRLYPRELRLRFGGGMEEVFGDSLREAAARRGFKGIVAVWGRALWELLTVAAPSRLENNTLMAGALSLLASSVLFLAFFSTLK